MKNKLGLSKIVKITMIIFTWVVFVGFVLFTAKQSNNSSNDNGISNNYTSINNNSGTTANIDTNNGDENEGNNVSEDKNTYTENLYVELEIDNGVKNELIMWQKIDSKYYLFLPTGVDSDKLKISETYKTEVFIDDMQIVSDKIYGFAEGKHTVRIGDYTTSLTIMKSENVPSVFINTKNDDDLSYLKTSKDVQVSGEITFMEKDGSGINVAMDSINGRGNTSWKAGELYDKYPFNIKLNEKTDVFGMGNNKKWCIIPQVFDESLIRNIITNDLSEAMGLENTPNAENVDVYFNGEYIGTYLLSQKVDMGKNKLIQSEDGFLVECELMERYDAEENKFITDRNQAIIVKSPNTIESSKLDEIREYIQRVEDAIYSDTGYNSNGEHYSDLIDVDSFVKVYLINEFSMNLDGGATSFFMYKNGDEKLKAGPVWDFDWAYGSYEARDGVNLVEGNCWYIKNKNMYDGDDLAIMAKLCTHPEFWDKVKYEWKNTLRPYVTAQLYGGDITSIDEYMEKYKKSAAMNFTRYEILPSSYVWGSSDTGSTYEENIKFLKEFYKRRIEFFNNFNS